MQAESAPIRRRCTRPASKASRHAPTAEPHRLTPARPADWSGFSLAIETSTRDGAVTLGRDDRILDGADLPQQRRHNLDLMAIMDQLLRRHGGTPRDLAHVFVSIGPGSFTGLRIAVATARMLARVLDVGLVAVPTIEVVVANVPTSAHRHVAACLNRKDDCLYAAVYGADGSHWRPVVEAANMTWDELLARSPRPLALVGAAPPQADLPADVSRLPADLARPRSDTVWRLGRARASAGRFSDPGRLLPLYARRPEAESLWEKRHGPAC